MAANNSWTGYETWARVFLFSKSVRCYDRTNARVSIFVLSFDSDKEGNDPIHGRSSMQKHVTFF